VGCAVADCGRAVQVVCGHCGRAVCARHARPAWEAADGLLCVTCAGAALAPVGRRGADRARPPAPAPLAAWARRAARREKRAAGSVPAPLGVATHEAGGRAAATGREPEAGVA
jgi:hypothetical protein